MGNRRFAQVSTSDEEDEVLTTKQQSSNSDDNSSIQKKMKLQEEEEEEESNRRSRRYVGEKDVEASELQAEDEDDQPEADAKPIGDVVRVSETGRGRKNHYNAFEYDGNRYDLEDSVLLVPEDQDHKPYVAIIKDITLDKDGMMVTRQWFYRPEEAERKGGGNWQSRDRRELFYSFHRDQVPAESVMHKCFVHFVPLHKQLPIRQQHPGFIVQKVYDTVEKKLWNLTDKDYEDSKQQEIDELVKKTMSRLGDLPDIEPEDAPGDQEDQLKSKRSFKRKNISPLDVTRDGSEATRSDHSLKTETPGSCMTNQSKHYYILELFDVLTGETHRDKWLERLLEGVQYVCYSLDNSHEDDMGKTAANGDNHENKNPESSIISQNGAKSVKSFLWPDAAVPAITALEKVSYDALSTDFQKYNQKIRQLVFNLKNNRLLAQRLLNGELEPSKILNMSPNELKDGMTAEETGATNEPDESEPMQMTDARCSRCTECKVGVREIIQTGRGERYKIHITSSFKSYHNDGVEENTFVCRNTHTRGITRIPELEPEQMTGERIVVQYNVHGQEIGKGNIKLQSYIGVLVRKLIPLACQNWDKDVPEELKEKIWDSLELSFVMDPKSKRRVMLSASKKFRSFRYKLGNHIKQYEDQPEKLATPPHQYKHILQADWESFLKYRLSDKFKKISEEAQEKQSKNTMPHHLSRKGYAQLAQDLELTDSNDPSYRAKLWKEARKDKNKEYVDPDTIETIKKINELSEVNQGQDILTEALGKPEHRGRVRGVGEFIPPSKYFTGARIKPNLGIKPTQPRTCVGNVSNVSNFLSMTHGKSVRDGKGYGVEVDVNASVKEGFREPFNDTQDLEKGLTCKLALESRDNIVAMGTMYELRSSMTKLNGIPLGKYNVYVLVDLVLEGNSNLDLPIPLSDEVQFLGQAINTVVRWPRSLVVIPTTAIDKEGCVRVPTP